LENQKIKEHLAYQASQNFASNQLEQQKVKEFLAFQSAQNFAATQLDQHKIKESLSDKLAESKYEALKNKDDLSRQLAECCCEIKTQQAASTADAKYEALKNQQMLSSQLANCCCEIKTGIDKSTSDILMQFNVSDSNKLRDSLNTANNEVNLLKIAERTRIDPLLLAYGFGGRDNNHGYGHHHHDHHYGGGFGGGTANIAGGINGFNGNTTTGNNIGTR
jgi:predicted transport protein